MLIWLQTESGEMVPVSEVTKVFWVKVCPYLDHEFLATNPRQVWCCHSHRVMYWVKNHDVPA